MTNEEIQRSVESFNRELPDGVPVIFNKLTAGMKFRHPKATKHYLLHIVFSCSDYIQYTKEDWITRVKPDNELWNATVQTFK